MRVAQYTLLVLAVIPPLTAYADNPAMKSGLWEYTMKMEMPGMPGAMPPTVTQRCLTQTEIDRGDQFGKDKQDDCKIQNLKQSATRASYDLACKAPPAITISPMAATPCRARASWICRGRK